MAIIDTSKGVRPVVEELAALEEIKYVIDNNNIVPLFNYTTNPNSFRGDTSTQVVSWVNNHDNSYTITVGTELTTNTYLIYTNQLEIDSLKLHEPNAAGFVETEPFAAIIFQDKAILQGLLQLVYKDKDGVSHTTRITQTPAYSFRRFSIQQSYLPISNVSIQVGARIRSDAVGAQETVLFYYNVFRLPAEIALLPIYKSEFIPALGFIEKSNQCMYDNYIAKQGATIDVTPINGIKYYH